MRVLTPASNQNLVEKLKNPFISISLLLLLNGSLTVSKAESFN